MSSLQDKYGHKLKYWTVEELQNFCIEHGLFIAEGLDAFDEVVMTGKGMELLQLLMIAAVLSSPEWEDED